MKSIQRQLTFRILLAVLTIGLAAGAFVYFHARETLQEEFDNTLAAKGRLVAGMVTSDEKGRLEFNTSDAEMAEFRRPHKPAYFEIWAGAGDPFERSPSLGGHDLPRLSVERKAVAINLQLPDGRAGRAAAIQFAPRVEEDDPHEGARPPAPPALTLVVAQDRHELDETLGIVATSLALAAIAMSAVAAIVVVVSVRQGLRPLNALARQADTIGAASLDQHFPVSGIPAELRPICSGLNDLLSRLSEAFVRERRFTADAAHELRTPIAELRALAEVAIKWPADASGEQNYRDALQIAAHMEALVTALLAIARSDAGKLPAQLADVDFTGVVRNAWSPHEPVAASRRLIVEWDLPAAAVAVRSDRALLAPLIGNLFSNAVAYTPDGGKVACTIATSENSVAFSISNDSRGLSAADLPHLFEPFWRKDPARGNTTHTGLGLALVRAYADALGATVKVHLDAGNVFSVSVDLPVTAVPPVPPPAGRSVPTKDSAGGGTGGTVAPHGLVVGSATPRIDTR